jgi:hypothetical protein
MRRGQSPEGIAARRRFFVHDLVTHQAVPANFNQELILQPEENRCHGIERYDSAKDLFVT